MPDSFLNPNEVVESLDIRPGEKIADFGSGAGFFSVPIAQRTGPSGKVYALDIRPEALDATRAKIKLYHLFNIEPQRADLEAPRGSGLKDESMDKVFISNILFQAGNKNAVISEAHRILRKGGYVIVIEWEDAVGVSGGPALDHRIGREETKNIFQKAGFSLYKEFAAGSHHYGLMFKK